MRYSADACESLHRLHAHQQEDIIAMVLTIVAVPGPSMSRVLLAVLLWSSSLACSLCMPMCWDSIL